MEPLRSYIQQIDAQQLAAEIIPAMRERLPELEPQPVLEPEEARFRLFNSITTFLRNAAGSQPLVMVLEDLQWADRSSLLLLEFLVRQIGTSSLLVIGTYRDVEVSRRHPLSQALGNLIREEGFLRVPLAGLSPAEVVELIQSTTELRAAPPLMETIHKRTEGNPLFVGEVIRILDSETSGDGQGATAGIPEGVRDAIGRRLDRLSRGCNQLLITASVIGREFEFKLLRTLTDDISEFQLLELVDEALESRMIEEVAGTTERYRFSHALVQETLAAELSTSRRVRLHARIGEALADLYQDDLEAHAAELAHHFAEAEPVLGPEKLVRYSLVAGEQALAAYAYEEGLGLLQRALDAKGVSLDSSEPAKDQETAALLFGLGRAQAAFTAERQLIRGAIATLRRAQDYYVDAEDVAMAVAVAELPIRIPTGHGVGITQLIARALALVEPNSHQAGRLLAGYGHALGIQEGVYEEAQEAFGRALEIAQREGDTALEMYTLACGAQVDHAHLRLPEGLEKALRAIQLAHRLDDPNSEISSRFVAINFSLVMGDFPEARLHGGAMLAQAEKLGNRQQLSVALGRNTAVSFAAGDWGAAQGFCDRALAVSTGNPVTLAERAWLEYELGEFSQGDVFLERLLEVKSLSPPGPTQDYATVAMFIPIIARITGLARRFEVAEEAAAAVLSSPFNMPLTTLEARLGLAMMAVQRGDVDRAGEQYTALKAFQGTLAVISIDRVRGLLSQTMGNLDQAAAHFEEALAFCRKAGYRPELAWTCCDYADLLLVGADGRPPRAQSLTPLQGDRAKALSPLEESLAIASERGMRPLMERVKDRLDRAQAQPEAAPAYPNGLSHREVEVLRLITLGKTNQEIGEELFITARTVANHVTNLLNKTNTANRAEAATYAARQGLV